MNYAEIKTMFSDILNRTDMTDGQADRFLSLGLRRAERKLHTVLQTKTTDITIDAPKVSKMAIPNDYLGLKFIKVDGVTLTRTDDRSLDDKDVTGDPSTFAVIGSYFEFRPNLPVGAILKISYVSEFLEAEDTDSITPATEIIPDILAYSALVYAADFYQDTRLGAWAGMLEALIGEFQEMSDRIEMSGGLYVANPYAGIC